MVVFHTWFSFAVEILTELYFENQGWPYILESSLGLSSIQTIESQKT